MESRLQLQNVDYNASCYRINGKRYELSSAYFPTVDPKNPYELTEEENQLIVFEKNRDLFCQLLAPYRRSQHYVISDNPGIIYDDMVADFTMIKSVVPYRFQYRPWRGSSAHRRRSCHTC